MSSVRKLASQTVYYGLSSIVGRMVNFLMVPIYTYQFSPAAYGVVSDLMAYTTYFLVLITFGMETAFFRFGDSPEKAGKAYTQSFVAVGFFSISLGLLLTLFHPQIANALDYTEYRKLFPWLIGTIVLDTLSMIPMARLRYLEKPKRYAIISLINIFLNIGLNILFLSRGMGIEAVFYAYFFSSAVKLGFALYQNIPDSWQIDFGLMKTMLNFGMLIMIAGLAGAINENLDKNLISALWKDGTVYAGKSRTGTEMTGIYAACYKLGMFISLVTQAFRYAAEPFFFKQAKEKNSKETFARIFHYFISICLLLFLFISSFDREIVGFNFFGLTKATLIDKKYWVGLEIVPVILLGNVFLGAYLNLSIWYKITRQARFGILMSGAGAILTILVNVLTIPFWGYMGSAWATLFCYAGMSILCYIIGQQYYPVPYRLERLTIYLLLALLIIQVNRSTPESIGLRLLLCFGYAGIMFMLEWKRPLIFRNLGHPSGDAGSTQ